MYFKIIKFILILLLVPTFSYAEDDEWYVHDFGDFIVASVPGEVVHGDKLIFSMEYKDCDTIFHLFTVLTTRAPEDIIQFENQIVNK